MKKDSNTWKSRSEEKVVGFTSASLFLARKREAVTQGGTRGIDYPTRMKTQGTRYRQMLGGEARPRMQSRYIHVKQEHERRRPDPPTIEPRLLPSHIYILL